VNHADNVAPVISAVVFSSLDNSNPLFATAGQRLVLEFTVVDAAPSGGFTLAVTIANQVITIFTTPAMNRYSYAFMVPTLLPSPVVADGDYGFTVTATDASGNSASVSDISLPRSQITIGTDIYV